MTIIQVMLSQKLLQGHCTEATMFIYRQNMHQSSVLYAHLTAIHVITRFGKELRQDVLPFVQVLVSFPFIKNTD